MSNEIFVMLIIMVVIPLPFINNISIFKGSSLGLGNAATCI